MDGGDYRAAPTFQNDVMGAYSFNNHALRRFHENLKDHLDPNGILAPSRGGIWPKIYEIIALQIIDAMKQF